MTRISSASHKWSAKAVLLLTFLGGLVGAHSASAALLGLTVTFPRIAYNNTGTTGYDAGSDMFAVNASALVYINGGVGASCPPFGVQCNVQPESTNNTQHVRIRIEVDDTGALVGGTPGDDLLVTGAVDVDGDTVIDFNGVLLTGEVLAFGSEDSGGPTDSFDFRFKVSGGLLNVPGIFAGQDIGVQLTSESSNFTGSFQGNFGGGAKGSVFPVEPEPIPDIDIEKATNGVDADDPSAGDTPQVSPGATVNWTYKVTNTGNVTLVNVVVTDDFGTPGDPSDDLSSADGTIVCPAEIDPLDPSEMVTCIASTVAEDLDDPRFGLTPVPGICAGIPGRPLYENRAVATGETATGDVVQDQDPSHYCNPPGPNIEVEKATNGVDADDPNAGDAPQVSPGDTVNWTYKVTNTGNVTLVNVVVTDDFGTPGDSTDDLSSAAGTIVCPAEIDPLDPGEMVTCTASGVAEDLENPSAGLTPVPGLCGGVPERPLYENQAVATGQTVTGDPVADEDASHYCNTPQPCELKVVKLCLVIEGDPDADSDKDKDSDKDTAKDSDTSKDTDKDGDTAKDKDGDTGPQGIVKYIYQIMNIGSSNITDITVDDDVIGPVPGSPIAVLVPDATVELMVETTLFEDTTNTVTVIGQGPGATTCEATDSATVLFKSEDDSDKDKDQDTARDKDKDKDFDGGPQPAKECIVAVEDKVVDMDKDKDKDYDTEGHPRPNDKPWYCKYWWAKNRAECQ